MVSGSWLDVGVDADDHGLAVDRGFGFPVAVAAGDGERLAGGGRSRRVQRDFDMECVVLDGGFHGVGYGVGYGVVGDSGGLCSIGLVLPVEDAYIASGHAEAVDVLQCEGFCGSAAVPVPIGEALRPAGLDGGFEIGCLDGIDMDGSQLSRLLAEDSEGGGDHERR